jgi:hypothetical protein
LALAAGIDKSQQTAERPLLLLLFSFVPQKVMMMMVFWLFWFSACAASLKYVILSIFIDTFPVVFM